MMNEPRSEQGRRRRTAAKTMSPSRSYCKQAREKERNRKQCSSHSANVATEEVGERGFLVARGEILSSRSEHEKFWQRCRQLSECASRRDQQDTKVYEREAKSPRVRAAHNEESPKQDEHDHERSITRRSPYTSSSSSSSSLCSDTNRAHHSRLGECEGRKTFTAQQQQINRRTNSSLKRSKRQQFHDCSYTTGENSRCNCSGRRRATLAGLIELFEQKVQVNECDNNRGGLEQGENRSESSSKERSGKNFVSGQFNKLNKQPQDHDRMRDIITPIKYETSDNDHDDNETDEDMFHVNYAPHSSDSITGCAVVERSTGTSNVGKANKVHRMAAKGVPILPRPRQPDLRRLTATHWQPATDGRQYEQHLRLQRRPKRSQSHNDSNDNEEGAKQETFEAQRENYSRLHSSTSDHREEEGELAQQERQSSGGELERPVCQAKASLAATRCPSIVKHQASSSRRLLSQLARLRRLNEPSYRVRRPEKVSQVEELIEQLEKATEEWENDELLLERAERRDWPAEYYERFQDSTKKKVEEVEKGRENNQKSYTTLSAAAPEEAPILQRLDYGCRADVGPFEEEAIARSHSHLSLMPAEGPLNEPLTGLSGANNEEAPRCASWTLGSYWGSRRAARRCSPRAFADRYHDDLAVRRLGHARAASSPTSSSERGQMIMMSYLLCSNAYTPSMSEANYKPTQTGQRSALGGSVSGDWTALERQLSEDDLHYRNYMKAKPEPFEPPFGIPRQLASASSHSTASHYLRRQESGDNQGNSGRQGSASGRQSSLPADVYCCSCGPQKVSPTQAINSDKQHQASGGKAPRSDSRVSFLEQVTTVTSGGSTTGWPTSGGGRASSADSGLARESPAGRQSRSQLVTPNSPFGPSSSSGRMNTRPISSQNSANLSARATPSEPTGEWSSDGGDAQLEDHEDLEAELDLDAELAFESPVQLACESPQPERLKASLVATPARQRPKINIENPRSKSPLVRVSNNSRHLEVQRQNRQRNCKQSEQKIVQIRCYGDVSQSKSSDSMSETECRFDFVDDGNDDGDEVANLSGNNRPQQAAVARSLAVPVINYETCQDTKSSTEAGDELLYKTHSSSKQLRPPAESFGSNRQAGIKSAYENHPTMPKTASVWPTKAENQTSKGLKFSIGEYKPLDKPSLKIL